VSQYECGLMFLAGPLLDFHTSGRVAQRSGNADPEGVTQNSRGELVRPFQGRA